MSPTGSSRKVVLAILFAALCVCGALILRTEPQHKTIATEESVVISAAPPRKAIPVSDSDGDGVPDWQDALQQTETLVINSQTTNYTPPETLTGQFAESFFEQMIRSQATGGGVNPDTFVEANARALFAQVSDEPITRADIITSTNNSPEALKNYGNQLVTIMMMYSDDSIESETQIVLDALNSNDPTRLNDLTPKIQAYTDYVTYTTLVPAPSIIVAEHLALLNAYQTIANDIEGMQSVFSDPALALVRLEQHQQNVESLLVALDQLFIELANAGVTWDENDPASALLL